MALPAGFMPRDGAAVRERKRMMRKIWKRAVVLFLAMSLLAAVAACGKEGDAAGSADAEQGGGDEEKLHHVEITVKDYGTIKVELDASAAPITVENFLKLAGDGFYDGLTFHRVQKDFVIQGGDPEGTGYGGSEEKIKGEFAANGVENGLSHIRGAISMARSKNNDSASSQFFIVQKDSDFLDGQYACFGYVTEGMEVVDAICQSTPAEDDMGTVLKENQPVIESVKVID